jgi:hypothetical protein
MTAGRKRPHIEPAFRHPPYCTALLEGLSLFTICGNRFWRITSAKIAPWTFSLHPLDSSRQNESSEWNENVQGAILAQVIPEKRFPPVVKSKGPSSSADYCFLRYPYSMHTVRIFHGEGWRPEPAKKQAKLSAMANSSYKDIEACAIDFPTWLNQTVLIPFILQNFVLP